MPAVDTSFAEWLRQEGETAIVAPAGAAAWAALGVTSRRPTPFATAAGGQAEAARRAEFHARPLVKDRIVCSGERRDLIAKCVTVAGQPAFVIGVVERDDDTSVLTVLRRLV